MNGPIDFVMIWVDGNDPEWRREKSKYDGKVITASNSEVRFRDWDNLQYWFRGVEKYAPWVNKIHFVTWGHIPQWLDTTNPKLNIVKHTDFIPEEYLPTFSSHTIELNLHRIEGLAEQFVYFNDDMFLTAPVKPEDFFKDGKPCDIAALDCIFFGKDSAGSFNGADITVINSHFKKKRILKRDWRKWYNLKNGVRSVIKTVLLYPWPWFPGLLYQHACNSFLKSTFTTVWAKEFELLDQTCSHRFRKQGDLNQWVMKFWQLAEGNFEVRREKFAYCYHVKESNFEKLLQDIPSGRHSLLCVNDTARTINFEDKKAKLKVVLEDCFSEISSFETKEYYTRVTEPEEIVIQDPATKKINAQRQKLLEGIDYLTEVCAYIDASKSGKLSKSRQLFVLQNLQGFVKVPVAPNELLSSDDANKFFALLKKAVSFIDADVIEQVDASPYYKFFITQFKTGAKPELYLNEQDLVFGYNQNSMHNLSENGLSLSGLNISPDSLNIEGYLKTYSAIDDSAKVIVFANGQELSAEYFEIEDVHTYLGIKVQKKFGFKVSIPLDMLSEGNITFAVNVRGSQAAVKYIYFKRTTALSNALSKAYYLNAGWKLTSQGESLTLKKVGFFGKLGSELAFLAQILKHNKDGGKKAVVVRIMLPILKLFVKKPIVIIEGEGEQLKSLFARLSAKKAADVWFVVPERYKDDGTLSSLGKIVNKETRKYKGLVLLSSQVFTDYNNEKIYNPFRKRFGFYKDIITKKDIVYISDSNSENSNDIFA